MGRHYILYINWDWVADQLGTRSIDVYTERFAHHPTYLLAYAPRYALTHLRAN